MRTGRLAEATLRCAARGELAIDDAVRQAMPTRPDLWRRAIHDITRARELVATRRGPELGEASRIINDLVAAALADPTPPGGA